MLLTANILEIAFSVITFQVIKKFIFDKHYSIIKCFMFTVLSLATAFVVIAIIVYLNDIFPLLLGEYVGVFALKNLLGLLSVLVWSIFKLIKIGFISNK